MTNSELLKCCTDAEYLGSDGFRVIVYDLFYGSYINLADNLPAINLGQYPSELNGEDDTTHLWVECSKVRRYLSRVRK